MLLHDLLTGWWARVGDTDVGGLHKVMLAEVRNFTELAQFYADEVITPARQLLEGLIRRGIEGGEFRRVDPRAVTLAVMSPLIFLMLHRHSFGACPVQGFDVDADATLAAHLDLVLTGLQVQAQAGARR